MDEFIQSAMSRFGISESTAKDATGSVLGFLKNGMGDDFSNITEKFPKAEQLADEEPSPAGGGGLMGSLTGAASSMLGGGGQSLELLTSLKNSGLSAEQGGSFVTMLINFLKEKIGANVIAQITEKMPMLKQFVG